MKNDLGSVGSRPEPGQAKIPFNKPGLAGSEFEYLKEAVNRGQLSGDGEFTKRCHTILERLTGSRKALLTHSCTAALEMAALLCDLQPGDEAIVPSFTFPSTANAIALRGATPVFVDIRPDTLNIDPARIADAMTDRTKAVFVVHYAGFAADMDAILALAAERAALVVEDAAQAVGSFYKGRACGALGDMGAFSFHETKNIISGEGGALLVNRDDLFSRAEIVREKGTDRSKFFRGEVDKYSWVDIGSSFLPGELVASYLLAQLEQEASIRARRLDLFDRYTRAFADLAADGRVRIPTRPDGCTGNGHMFYLLMANRQDRADFIAHMGRHGIGTPFHYVPLHSAPAGQRFGRTCGPMDVTDTVSGTLVRLPMFAGLFNDIDRVITVARSYFDHAPRAPE